MEMRNATSTTPDQREITRNMCHITELSRKIVRLEEEEAELKQRLSMILANAQENKTEINQLANFQQEGEHQLQVQESLNFAIGEEINELRRVLGQQQLVLHGGDVNTNRFEPSTSQGAENSQDVDPEPKE